MRKTPLLVQVILINSIVFLVMGIFGYFLVIPAIERPYVDEAYEQVEFQLEEFMTSTEFHPDRRFIYLRYTVSTDTVEYINNFPNATFTMALSELIPDLAISSNVVESSLDITTAIDETSFTLLYSYQAEGDFVYLVATQGTLNPLLNDSTLITRIIGLAILAFFLPVLAVMIWSLFISASLRSVNHRLHHPERHQRPLLLAQEIDAVYQALVDYEKEIAQTEKDKQVLFQSISHELKTPIAAIQSYAEAIEDGLLSPTQIVDSSKIIQEKTKVLLEMVNQIMQLNRVSYLQNHRTAEQEASLINISDVLFQVMNRYQQVHPHLVFEAQLEPMLFRGEASTWKTVLGNIFDNNIRHGATQITIKLEDDFMQIDNNGELIPEELLSQLFTPFMKGEKGSFGLGLTIIQKALLPYKYDIRIDNTPQGVRYTISSLEVNWKFHP